MKIHYAKSMLAGILAIMMSACDKKAEVLDKVSDVNVKAVAEDVYPLDGKEMSTAILPPKRPLAKATLRIYEAGMDKKVKVIDTVCDEYIKETKLFDLTNIREGQPLKTISNGELTIKTDPDFNQTYLVKLPKGPTGWWTHWGYSPYTESEYPTVLYCYNEANGYNSISLAFSKPLKIFGFETAPNTLAKDYTVQVVYRIDPTYRSSSYFALTQTTSSPSGARLIALKTTASLVFVEINYAGSREDLRGVAIANIRYALKY